MRLVVFAYVFKLEALRQIEVILHRPQLPEATDSIFNLDVNFRPVESAFAFYALVIDVLQPVQSSDQHCFSLFPLFVRAQIILAGIASLHRQLELDLVEAKGQENILHEINAIVYLLLRRSEEHTSEL